MKKGVTLTSISNKGSRSELLPNRHSLNQISGGDPGQRSINNYSKVTPGVMDTGADVTGVPQKIRNQ